jgi:hypothetical protein
MYRVLCTEYSVDLPDCKGEFITGRLMHWLRASENGMGPKMEHVPTNG